MAELTANETAVYDRQIRLWGVEAQKKLQNSSVLVLGLTGIGVEVSKNLVLAGVSVTIHDDSIVSEFDYHIDMLIDPDSLGKVRSEACFKKLSGLNPLTKVNRISGQVEDIQLKEYDLVCLCDLPSANHRKFSENLNNSCRKNHCYFMLALSLGFSGLAFFDLGNSFEYKIRKKDEGESKTEIEQFNCLESVLKLDFTVDKYYKQGRKKYDTSLFAFLKYMGIVIDESKVPAIDQMNTMVDILKKKVELAPVCAILGGMVGQEIIKVMSRNGKPINNFFFYNSQESQGITKTIA